MKLQLASDRHSGSKHLKISHRGRILATIFSLFGIVFISFAPVHAQSTYDNDVLTNGANGYWSFSNATGDNSGLTDQSSTGNNMSEVNVTHGAAQINAGASYSDSFNGTSSTATASSAGGTLYTATQNFSIEAWIKPTSIPAQGSRAGIAGKEGSYWLYFDGQHLSFDLSQSGDHLCDDPDTAIANNPYYVVGTYDGRMQKLYVNGSLVCSQGFSGNVDMTSNPIVVGSWDTNTGFYAGYLSNVAVYGSVLTASQISTHYTDGDARPIVQECGTLGANETWDATNVYLVTCQVEVPSGVTLAINPDATVKYTAMGYVEADSGGALDISGTAASPIVFTSVNDNSIGEATGSGTPAVNDYSNAIVMNGGIVNAQHAQFKYAGTSIGDSENFISSGSTVNVTGCLFQHSTMAIFLNRSPLALTFKRNTVSVNGVSGPNGDPAILVANDPDLSGVSLAGSDANIFTGNNPAALTFSVLNSTVPAGSTWEIDSSVSHVTVSTAGNAYGAGINVNGTLALDSGSIWEDTAYLGTEVTGTANIQQGSVIKNSQTSGWQVDSGGNLNVTGTAASPVVFTSINDNTVGGATGTGSPAVGEYTNALVMYGGTLNAQHAEFDYASTAVGDNSSYVNSGSTVTITDSSFQNGIGAISLTRSPVTLTLERDAFQVTGSSTNPAVAVANDADLSSIVLAGNNADVFTGSSPSAITLSILNSTIPSTSTWEIDSSVSHVIVATTGNNYGSGVTVNGTLTLDSGTVWENLNDGMNDLGVAINGVVTLQAGVISKGTTNGWQVDSGGRLNVTGTSASPVIFTSVNDNSVGGNTGSGTPSMADNSSNILMHGGTANIQFATFDYAKTDIGDAGGSGDAGSNLVVTDSTFESSIQGISQSYDSAIVLQNNSFSLLTTSGSGNSAISVVGDPDLSGIALSGAYKNTFSGTGPDLAVIVNGGVAAGQTWTLDPTSQAVIILNGTYNNTYAVSVDGTVDIIPGEYVKVEGSGFDVQSDGILNVEGSTSSPVVFTSVKDDTIGGDSNGDGTSSGATGDYTTAIRYEQPSSSDLVSYTVFKYGGATLSVGIQGTLNIDHDQFTHNANAFNADTTSTNNPVLGSLAPDCLWPYANSIHISNSWFGSTGEPGSSMDLSSYLGETIPSGYSGLQQEYNYFTYLYPLTASISDNTIPWTLFTCGIPDGPSVTFPVTDVNVTDFPSPAIAGSQLWTDPNLAE